MRQWSLLGFAKHLAYRSTMRSESRYNSIRILLQTSFRFSSLKKICLSEQERALDLITEGARPTRSLADGLQCDCPFFQKKKNVNFLVQITRLYLGSICLHA